jgi:hypothetical protein
VGNERVADVSGWGGDCYPKKFTQTLRSQIELGCMITVKKQKIIEITD